MPYYLRSTSRMTEIQELILSVKDELKGAIGEIKAETSSIQKDIAEIKEQNKTTTTDIAAMLAEMKVMKEKNLELESENSQLKCSLTRMKTDLSIQTFDPGV